MLDFMNVLAATSPEQTLYEYGLLGVIVVAVSGIAWKLFNIILKDRDKAMTNNDALIQDVFTKVLPAIAHNTQVLEERQEIDRDIIHIIKEATKQLENNTRACDEFRLILKHGQNNGRMGGA